MEQVYVEQVDNDSRSQLRRIADEDEETQLDKELMGRNALGITVETKSHRRRRRAKRVVPYAEAKERLLAYLEENGKLARPTN